MKVYVNMSSDISKIFASFLFMHQEKKVNFYENKIENMEPNVLRDNLYIKQN